MAGTDKKETIPSLENVARKIKTPLYEQIKASLRQIIKNEFENGDRFYTERDLIKHLGASLLTVRRALADLVTEGYLERKVGSGTFVRKGDRLKSVGVFLPDYTSPFFVEVLEELAVATRKAQVQLNIYHTQKGESVREALHCLKSSPQEEGIVLLGNSVETNLVLHESLTDRGFRTVLYNGFLEGLSTTGVRIDNQQIVDDGIAHLSVLGHQRIVFLLNEPLVSASIRPLHKVIEQKVRSQQDTDWKVVNCGTRPFDDSCEAAYRQMSSIMSEPNPPTAVFAVSDAGGIGALRYCLKNDIAVPEKLSVLAINNTPLSRYSHPTLSTFAYPTKEMVEKTIELLTQWNSVDQTILFKSELIIRESTGPVVE